MIEEWRVVSGFSAYLVSSLGNIRRAIPADNIKTKGDYRRAVISPAGYEMVTLTDGCRRETKSVHRLVCRAFRGPPPSEKHVAAHSNGIKTDNREINLRWATRSENEEDKILHGTMNQGTRHHKAKLNDDMVRKIRKDNRPSRVIAREIGMDKSIILDVKNRKIWKHVEEENEND